MQAQRGTVEGVSCGERADGDNEVDVRDAAYEGGFGT